MTIAFTCPNCLTDLRLNDRYAGECVNCPRCHGLMVVPDVVANEVVDDLAASATRPEPDRNHPPVDDWQAHLRPPAVASTGTPGTKPVTPSADRVKFLCLCCGTKMSAATSAVGRHVTCPTCKTRQQIPGVRNGDTTHARADETPTQSLTAPYLTGNPRAMVTDSDSLIDALDDVELAEARAPVASPFLTGYTTVAPRRERSPSWLFSWSTILAALGTLLGLLLVWVAMSAPALYRDHVQPYFEKQTANVTRPDPTRQLMQEAEALIGDREKATSILREIHDVESAQRIVPAFMQMLLRMSEIELSTDELGRKLTANPPRGESREQLARLNARAIEELAAMRQELSRCATIPGVSHVLADAMSAAVSHNPNGAITEILQKTPQGREFAAAAKRSSQQPNEPSAPVSPPDAITPRTTLPSPRTTIVPPEHDSATAEVAVSNTHEDQPAPSPAEAARAGQLIASLLHLSALQTILLERSQEITDLSSLKMKALAWAGAAHMWQRQEATVEKMAGQEFVGDDAQRYADIKETTDRQRGQLIAEFDRLEKLGALPQLNARLVRHGGNALGSGSIAVDDDSGSKKPLKRPSPRALKRVTTP
jgi:hypothetical protein